MTSGHPYPAQGNAPTTPHRRRGRIAMLTLALATTVLTIAPTGGADAVAPSSFLGTTPYLRLFTQVGDCQQITAANQLSGSALTAKLDELTSYFVHFHSEGSNSFQLGSACQGSSATTLASKLAARGVWVSNYRNGSFVSQANVGQINFNEAADIETKAPLAIGTYWPGNYIPNRVGNDNSTGARLTAALTASATTVRISQVASADRPSGTASTWPWINSKGTGLNANAHSKSTADYVSWIRIDNELMQVIANPTTSGSDIVLSVRRGLWGTGAAAHAASARVMAPTYLGNRNADASLSGTPSRNDASYPLRYAIKIWQSNGYGWLADRIQATFGTGLQGFNTIWLDVSSCHQDNHSDPYGNPVFGWYDAGNTKMMATQYGIAQKAKLAGLRARFPGVKFAGNNMFQNDACNYDLLGNAYDGGVIENYLMSANGSWAEQMETTFAAMVGNWPAIYWARWDYGFSGSMPAYKRYTYVSVLLAYRTTDTKYQYGGSFNLTKPDELYMWNLGTPTGSPTSITDVDIPGTSLYRRDFANGFVVVNAGSSSATYSLGGTYYDAVNKDSSGNPKAVTSVTIAAHDAAFLLKGTSGGGGGDTTAPDTTLTSPAPGSNQSPGSLTITGGATDSVGVTAVDIGIQNTSTGRWLQTNGTWGMSYTALPATLLSGTTSRTWRYPWSAIVGTFMVRASARDAAGNVDATPATTTFMVR